ncbi:MAG: DUF488 family protein [Pseudomonadota bacterium]
MAYSISVKRVYEAPSPTDGYRILVDRLWPRGLSRDHAAFDAWMKEIAPSHALRRWFAHDPKKWGEFQERYRAELETDTCAALIKSILERAKLEDVTLLFAAKNEKQNNVIVLKHVLDAQR